MSQCRELNSRPLPYQVSVPIKYTINKKNFGLDYKSKFSILI